MGMDEVVTLQGTEGASAREVDPAIAALRTYSRRGRRDQIQNTAVVSRAAAGGLLRSFEVGLADFCGFQAPKGGSASGWRASLRYSDQPTCDAEEHQSCSQAL
jgi:hypothetical protein